MEVTEKKYYFKDIPIKIKRIIVQEMNSQRYKCEKGRLHIKIDSKDIQNLDIICLFNWHDTGFNNWDRIRKGEYNIINLDRRYAGKGFAKKNKGNSI